MSKASIFLFFIVLTQNVSDYRQLSFICIFEVFTGTNYLLAMIDHASLIPVQVLTELESKHGSFIFLGHTYFAVCLHGEEVAAASPVVEY